MAVAARFDRYPAKPRFERKAYRLIAALKSHRIKIVLDPANLFEVAKLDEQRSIVSSAIDLLADRIVMAHAKDRNPDGSFAT
ncbi:hypothetical protein AB9F41_36820, partial [Rhizobium leguminosarum]